MMSTVKLNPVSFVVLGLVARDGPCTSYDLKKAVEVGVAGLWAFKHAQLYTEPERLAAAGLLDEEQEERGRRRRLYRVTPAGREALARWLADPSSEVPEIRHVGLLKLYFGAFAQPEDIVALARAQARTHEDRPLRQGSRTAPVVRGDRPHQLQVIRMIQGFGSEPRSPRTQLADDDTTTIAPPTSAPPEAKPPMKTPPPADG